MKILFCTDSFLPEINGLTLTIDRICRGLSLLGHEAQVIAPEYREKLVCSYKVERTLSFSLPFYSYCRIAYGCKKKIKERMRDFLPDLVHITTPFVIGLTARRIALDLQIPLIASYHTNFHEYASFYGLNFGIDLYWNYMIWFHKCFNANLYSTEVSRKILAKQNMPNLVYWERGIDTDFFSDQTSTTNFREKWGLKKSFIVLYVGRLALEKNLEMIFSGYQCLPESIKSEIQLLVVGDGPMRSRLERLAPPDTVFTGFLRGVDLVNAYKSSDIFVCPSTTEVVGNVVLEAMASGLPIVVPDVDWVREYIKPGWNGLCYEAGKPTGMAEMIATLLKDHSLKMELSQNALQWAKEHSFRSVLQNLTHIYENVIREHHMNQGVSDSK